MTNARTSENSRSFGAGIDAGPATLLLHSGINVHEDFVIGIVGRDAG